MTRPTIRTRHLLLRRFTAADAAFLFALDNDPEVMRYINGGTPASHEHIERQIIPVFTRPADPPFGFWAAGLHDARFPTDTSPPGDGLIGWFCLREGSATRCELGYRLCRTAWGQGLATEGARELIARAFAAGALAVCAATYQDNRASIRVMEKAGMRFVRRFRLTAHDIACATTYHADSPAVWDGDDVEYAIERTHWRNE